MVARKTCSPASCCREYSWPTAQLLPSGSTAFLPRGLASFRAFPARDYQQGHLGRPAPSVRQETPLDRPLRRGNSPLTWWRLSCPELPSRCFLTSHPPSFLLFSHRCETCTQSNGCRHPYLPLIPPPVSVLYSNPILELASSGTRTITLLSYHISPLKIFLEKFPFLVYIEISHCFPCPILFSNLFNQPPTNGH